MILQPQQARRFVKLFEQLMAYAAYELGILGNARGIGLTDERILDVARELWKTDESRKLVAKYAYENPDGLSRADLAEVSAWKEAIFGRFAMARDGRDVLFLYGDHAFAVRGISREVDAATGRLPGFGETVILPFDGFITYGEALSMYDVDFGPGITASINGDVREHRAKGSVVSRASAFARESPIAREENLRQEAEEFARRTELEMNAHELSSDQHEGALAGLSPEERKAAVEANSAKIDEAPQVAEIFREIALETVDGWVMKGKPTKSLATIMRRLPKENLLRAARRFKVPGNLSAMSRARLADGVITHMPCDIESLIGTAVLMGAQSIEDLRRVYDAGGAVDVPRNSVTKVGMVPRPTFPGMVLFCNDDTYQARIMDEAMEGLRDTDWDEWLERAREYDEGVRYLQLVAELRGISPVTEAVREAAEHSGAEPVTLLLAAGERMRIDHGFPFFFVEMEDGVSYLIHEILAEDCGLDDEGRPEYPDVLYDLLDEQADKVPRPIDELFSTGATDFYDWVAETPRAQELLAYFDAHVPDGASDYAFADNDLMDVIFEASRNGSIEVVLRMLEEHEGFIPTEAQLNHVLGLITAVMNDTPRWTNNGWTPNELVHQGWR